MYGAPLSGEEQKIEGGTYAPGQEAVMADVHVRDQVDGRTCLNIQSTLVPASRTTSSINTLDQPSKVPADVELRDSRFHQSLLAEWFGTTVFLLFLCLVRLNRSLIDGLDMRILIS